MEYLNTYLDNIKTKNLAQANSIKNTAETIGKEYLSKFDFCSHKMGLLFGNVQSGKTGQVFGVVCKAVELGFQFFILLTTDNVALQKQTYERTERDLEQQNGFVVCSEEDEQKFRSHGVKPVIIVLKKNSKILKEWTNKLKNIDDLKGNPLFIIDDEADLASTGSNDLEDNRYANMAIKNLLETIPNYNYLSVTATPQAQVLLNENDAVKPKHVFTYEPGQGYMGIEEFFSEESFFDFVDGDEWDNKEINIIPESLKNAIIRYFINISYMILDKGFISSTTMLIHTSVAIEDHYKLMRLLIKYKDNLIRILKLDKQTLDYNLLINQIKMIFDESKFDISWDDDYILLLIKIIECTNINIINSDSDDVIIENINNIVLGSKKVERGVTMDNLLVTYITNYHDGVTAVDTILQRARWFGYREGIRKYIKIFITRDLFKEYKECILPAENELWNRLKNAEENDNFHEFEKYISLNGRSAPTNKVRTTRSSGEKILFYDSSVDREIEIERNAKSIYLHFAKQDRKIINIVGRSYTGLIGLKFLDFCEQIKESKIYETIGIDQYFWSEIRQKADNYPFCVLFLDENGKDDFRERTPENGKYQLFEGSNDDTNFPGEQALYKVDGLHDKVVVCLHKIRDKLDNKLRYYVSLHLPKDNIFIGKFYVKD